METGELAQAMAMGRNEGYHALLIANPEEFFEINNFHVIKPRVPLYLLVPTFLHYYPPCPLVLCALSTFLLLLSFFYVFICPRASHSFFILVPYVSFLALCILQ